jgi:hypothetical protein
MRKDHARPERTGAYASQERADRGAAASPMARSAWPCYALGIVALYAYDYDTAVLHSCLTVRFQMDSEFIASTYLSQGVDGLSQRRYVLLDPASYSAKQQPPEPIQAEPKPDKDSARESKEEEEEEESTENEPSKDRGGSQTLQTLQSRDAGSADPAPAQTAKAIEVQCSGLTCDHCNIDLIPWPCLTFCTF